MKNEQTSKRVATLAGKVLSNPHSSKIAKILAASTLAQTPDKKKRR